MDAYALIRLTTGADRTATANRLRASLGPSTTVRTAHHDIEGMESAFGVGVSDFDIVVESDRDALDVHALRTSLADEPIDVHASCVAVGKRRVAFQDITTVRFYCLIERADDLDREQFAHDWNAFTEVVETTPGQIAYEQVVIDATASERLGTELGLPDSGADGLAIGGFADLAGLESAVSWANIDEPHRTATTTLLAPRYRKILTPTDV